jgi:hypothetical protein
MGNELFLHSAFLRPSGGDLRFVLKTLKRYLINFPYLCDYGQTIFCLSFLSRDRATAPGRC